MRLAAIKEGMKDVESTDDDLGDVPDAVNDPDAGNGAAFTAEQASDDSKKSKKKDDSKSDKKEEDSDSDEEKDEKPSKKDKKKDETPVVIQSKVKQTVKSGKIRDVDQDAPCDSAKELEDNNKKAEELIEKIEQERKQAEKMEEERIKRKNAAESKKANHKLHKVASGPKESKNSKKTKHKTATKLENDDNKEASKEVSAIVKVQKKAKKDAEIISHTRAIERKRLLGEELTKEEKAWLAADEKRSQEEGEEADMANWKAAEENTGDKASIVGKTKEVMPSVVSKAPVVHSKHTKVNPVKTKEPTKEVPCDSEKAAEESTEQADKFIEE